MENMRFCACGCGSEVKTWTNGTTSPFLRGHHMRKPGYQPPNMDAVAFCKCGCGSEIKPLFNGHMRTYIKGHHLRGKELTLNYRTERLRKRWNREPIFSPFLENVFVSYNAKSKRWTACIIGEGKKSQARHHAKAVYENYHGVVPEGYVVHHKNGRADRLEDDHPDNLMLLLDGWNLRYFPVLAKGFGVPEEVVTSLYLKLDYKNTEEKLLFSQLCSSLVVFTSEKARKKGATGR